MFRTGTPFWSWAANSRRRKTVSSPCWRAPRATAIPPADAPGMLVSGDFGVGKSHLLTHLEHLALSRNFVCSKVAISKETPLYDLGKVFTSAIENARMPGERRGQLVEELAPALKSDSDSKAALFRWADGAASAGLLSPIFPASLLVYERSGDSELDSAIESFWAGGQDIGGHGAGRAAQDRRGTAMPVPGAEGRRIAAAAAALRRRARQGRRLCGLGGAAGRDRADRLVHDPAARGRAYAELARWMGRAAAASPVQD